MKLKILFAFILLSLTLSAQFQQIYSTGNVQGSKNYYFIDFEKSGENWERRLVALDTMKFEVMTAGYSTITEFTYNFSNEERLAGLQFYSSGYDFNGDGFMDFYSLSYHGTATDYRSSVKIISIATGSTLFELNQSNMSYSIPYFMDINADGTIEAVFVKYAYPYPGAYSIDVYSTGLVSVENEEMPQVFSLSQNFPNPFSLNGNLNNAETRINFSIQNPQQVQVEFTNINGEVIRTYDLGYLNAGEHSIAWDGKNNSGAYLSSGVYFYSISVAGFRSDVKKMILLK